MSSFAVDNMISELVYEAEINVRKYARCVLNLSRIGNIHGANYYKEKLNKSRNILRTLRGQV